ncbi:MAG TPA: alpha/beta hydrolase [Ktedonobacterales bacterium]|jgi:pimeloyl-ACP methyl ester carboxylesterase|nr:alpha/beta hydrolase [Ktedonobacterales bacterium]
MAESTSEGADELHDNGAGNYAEVHGLKMYYEIHGEGFPLVLLHGGLSAIGTSFGKVLPGLARGRRVIAVEQQAHGHTADIDRPLTYGQMADDTVALLQHIGIEQADFFGYSIGGGLAMEVAVEHPSMVRKLVVATPIYNPDGFQPGVLAGIEALQPELLAGTPFQEEYASIAPNPQEWPRLIAKTKQLDREFAGWSPEAIQSFKAPTLLIAGDADIVRPEHAVELFRLRGGGAPGDNVGLPNVQLAVLPGTTHITLVDRAEWLVSMIAGFLDAPMPA